MTGRIDSGALRDNAPTIGDSGVIGPPQLGDPCRLPDFEQGELDPCGVDDPNLYCLEQIDGDGAYCSIACAIEPHHGGIDVGPHDHPLLCGANGCCLPLKAETDAGGEGEAIDWVCRFASECQ